MDSVVARDAVQAGASGRAEWGDVSHQIGRSIFTVELLAAKLQCQRRVPQRCRAAEAAGCETKISLRSAVQLSDDLGC